MLSVDDIKQQMRLFGEEKTLGLGGEIKALPNLLHDSESIKAALSGFLENHTWLMICTEKRILLINKGMVYGLKHKEVMLSSISSINFKTGMMFGEITITVSGAELKITQVSKKLCSKFVEVTHANRNVKTPAPELKPIQSNSNDFIEQLQKIAELKEKGLLTDDEFLAAKSKLLK
jgi:hypothetical protein